MIATSDVYNLLSDRINLNTVNRIVRWAIEGNNKIDLLSFTKEPDVKISRNALWILTHLQPHLPEWLASMQNELIDHLLTEHDTSKKRMYLQLLRNQEFHIKSFRGDFLEFCLSKINSQCEPYAIRCFSIYCALKQCLHSRELINELDSYLDMMHEDSLSPGLKSALRQTKIKIKKIRNNYSQNPTHT